MKDEGFSLGAELRGYASIYGGAADGQDALVVIDAGNGAVAGKCFNLDTDGKIVKDGGTGPARSEWGAFQVAVPTPEAMVALLKLVGKHEPLAILVGRFPDPPEGVMPSLSASFWVVSEAEAIRQGGVLDGWFPSYENVLANRRSKETMLPSSWLLLDRDFTDCQPAELVFHGVAEWWQAMCKIAPGLDGAARVDLPSSSSRLLDKDGRTVFPSPSSHHFVQMADADELPTLGTRMLTQAMAKGLGWRRMWGGKPSRSWSIFDPSTFTWERISYDGAPRSTVPQTRIAPPIVSLGARGGRFDSSTVPMPTEAELGRLRARYGLDVRTERRTSASGATVTVATLKDRTALRLDTTLTVQLPDRREWTGPLADLWAWAAVHLGDGKLRAQTPFRASSSWAGLVRFSAGLPIVYDVGTHTVFTLHPDDRAGPEPVAFLQKIEALIAEDILG